MGSPDRLLRGCLLGAAIAGCAHRPAPVAAPPPPPPVVEPAPPPPPAPRAIRIVRPAGDEPTPIFGVQVDEVRVYFNDGAGRLWSAPKDGSAPATELIDDAHDVVRSFVLDGGTVYYAAREGMRSVPAHGGPCTRWVEHHGGPVLLASDGEHVYHTVFDGSATFRLSLATGRAERFAPGGKHQTLAVDETHVYIASYFGGTISAVSKKTRRSRVLAAGVRRPVRLLVEGDFVYFTSEADGTVRRVSRRGGPVEVLARGQRDQEHLAYDGRHVYWATRTPTGAALMRAPVTAGADPGPEEVYGGLRSAAGISVDDSYVYVADRGAGEIVRVRKNP